MRNYLSILFLFFSLIVSGTDYYVKTGGNDAASGLDDANAWETVTKVNTVWAAGTFALDDIVYFNRDDAWYGVTLIPAESGTAGHPITISAYGVGADPIISGFTTLASWTDEGGSIYSKAVTSAAKTNMVTIDGVQVGMGRYPDSGWKTYESAVANTSITDNTLSEEGTDWDNAEVVVKKNDYLSDRGTITSNVGDVINYTEITGTGTSGTNGYGYFIQSDIRCVTATNEWFHDYSGGEMFIYGDPAAKTVKAATLSGLVTINNYDYLTFDNIIFEGCIADAFTITSGSAGVTFQNCEVRFIGRCVFNSAAGSLTVNLCNIHDINGNSIYGTYPNLVYTNNTLSDVNQIDGTGYGYYGTRGINIISSTSALIQYNTLEDIAYHGISANGNNVFIKNNLIIDVVNKFLDGGAIYTFGNTFTGREITDNIIINISGSTAGTTRTLGVWYHASGIYLDEPCADVLVENNTLANCLNGIKLHRAHEIDVHNNIIYNPVYVGMTLQWASSTDANRNIDIDGNLVVVKNNSGRGLFFSTTLGDLLSFGTSDNNYWARPIDDDYVFYAYTGSYTERTLAQWQVYSSQDAASNKSPITPVDTTEIDFYYNYSAAPVIEALPYASIDLAGTKYAANYTVPAWSSVVLLKDPDPDIDPPGMPAITTGVPVVYSKGAICGASGISANNGTISERGVCWNTTGSPTTSDSKITMGIGENDFTAKIVGLTPLTTYYLRFYVTNEIGTTYGYEEAFTTSPYSVHSSSGKIIMGTGKVIVID